MKEVLIVCAMQKEGIKIASRLELDKVNDSIFRKGSISLLISGIGKQKTAISLTQYLCNNVKPELIVNIGYAGATDIQIGKWVNVTKCFNYEWDIPGEEKYSMLDFGNQELVILNLEDMICAPCYTAEAFVTNTELTEQVVFDMELHSVALICDMENIKLLSLKKVSDNLSLEKYYDNLKSEEVFELESSVKILKESNLI